MQQQTTLKDLVDFIRVAKPFGTVYMGMYRANARFAVPDGAALIYGFLGEYGRNFTVIQTRYEDVDGIRVPRELLYFCLSLAENRETAAAYLYQTAAHVHSICCLSANAGAGVIQETLFTEFPYGLWKRFTRQFPFPDMPAYPLGGRFVAREETIRLAGKIWSHPERERLLFAIAQYEEALRLWRHGASPLICQHLWPTVEALTEVVFKRVQAEKGMTLPELAEACCVPKTQQSRCKACKEYHEQIVECPSCGNKQPPTKNDLKYHVRAAVTRAEIFQGDDATHAAIRHANINIKHGTGTFAEIWNVDFSVYEKTAKYIRHAIFDVIELSDEDRAVFESDAYAAVYMSPQPPEKQDGGGIIVPYEIFQPKQDWYAFYTPQFEAVDISEDNRSFTVRYKPD